MKKFKSIIIFSCLALVLAGCDGTNVASSNESEKAIESKEIVFNQPLVEKDSGEIASGEIKTTYQTIITQKDDGKWYSIVSKDFRVDMVIGDNYYDTQLADIMKNFSLYEGKTIEIEGFVLNNGPYTFVGRYSENSLCPTCPAGYSYFEYEWHGDEKLKFENETTWVKIKGELKKGNDGVEYYYIDAYELEVMNEWGKVSTVVN